MKIILCVAFCIISEILTYKFIKIMDKKERKKLQKWENQYVDKMKPETDRFLEMQELKKKQKLEKEKKESKK